jgi:hypothetical protein
MTKRGAGVGSTVRNALPLLWSSSRHLTWLRCTAACRWMQTFSANIVDASVREQPQPVLIACGQFDEAKSSV